MLPAISSALTNSKQPRVGEAVLSIATTTFPLTGISITVGPKAALFASKSSATSAGSAIVTNLPPP